MALGGVPLDSHDNKGLYKVLGEYWSFARICQDIMLGFACEWCLEQVKTPLPNGGFGSMVIYHGKK